MFDKSFSTSANSDGRTGHPNRLQTRVHRFVRSKVSETETGKMGKITADRGTSDVGSGFSGQPNSRRAIHRVDTERPAHRLDELSNTVSKNQR